MPAREGPTLREIFDANAEFVWRALRYLGVRESDLPDLCQEVFIVVHRRLCDFEGRSSMRTWLYGICIRVAHGHRRRAYMRHETTTDRVPENPAEGPHVEMVEQLSARETLLGFLSHLDESRRVVFVLYEIEQLTLKEIAETLEVPLQTAYSRLTAARKQVAELAKRGGRP